MVEAVVGEEVFAAVYDDLTFVQAILMLLEPPLWLIWQIILFVLVFLLNCRELLVGVKKLLRRA